MQQHRRARLAALALTLGLTAVLGMHTARAQAPHTVLDTWLSGLTSLRTQFTQTIKDAQGAPDRSDPR